MINNLFSIFDPSSISIYTSWIIPSIVLLSPALLYTSKPQAIFISAVRFITNEIIAVSSDKFISFVCSSIFSVILFRNVAAILPFIFTINSQLRVVFPIGLTIWLAIFLSNLTLKFNKTMAHLVPLGTPVILIPVIVLIELIRNVIRPITLSVRLMANLTAGHLLLHLLRSFTLYANLLLPILPVRLILTLLEVGVAIIQAYIFSILLALYARETH